MGGGIRGQDAPDRRRGSYKGGKITARSECALESGGYGGSAIVGCDGEAVANVGDELEGAEAGGLVVDVGGDDEFVWLRDFEEAKEAAFDGFNGTDNGAKE